MNYHMGKKGLSDVITTVLIILLVLAAVVIIWSFIRRPIEQGGKQIEGQGQCLRLELEPTACVKDNAAGKLNITARWISGDVDKLSNVTIIVTDTVTGKADVATISAPSKLGTTSGQITVSNVNIASGTLVASVAGIVTITDGSTITCTESLTKKSCS